MMRRPADQCKLLFLYLLRCSSAAFASSRASLMNTSRNIIPRVFVGSSSRCTNPSPYYKYPVSSKSTFVTTASSSSASSSSSIASSSSSSSLEEVLEENGGHISLRIAHREDIPDIQRCNLATLPENYNSNFYAEMLRFWPDLALVVEHIPPSRVNDEDEEDEESRISFFGGAYDPMTSSSAKNRRRIVGYVLGKVDPPTVVTNTDIDGISYPYEQIHGHVTSLAILDSYRRRGLAWQLMNQLHIHLRQQYHVQAVGLHVRVSNEAARKLYQQQLGYTIQDVIPMYYQDGEDAYLMKKDLVTLDPMLQPTPNTLTNDTTTTTQRTLLPQLIPQHLEKDTTTTTKWIHRYNTWVQKRRHTRNNNYYYYHDNPFRLPRIVWNSDKNRIYNQSQQQSKPQTSEWIPDNYSSSSSSTTTQVPTTNAGTTSEEVGEPHPSQSQRLLSEATGY